jgi:RNA polymerase sigma-70 factor, ECF subfamily
MASRFEGPTGAHEDSGLTRQAVALAKAGDPEGLHYLYVRYVDDVLRNVTGIVHDRRRAEEITHRLFVNLTAAIGDYEGRELPFSAWVLRVARDAALDLRGEREIPADEIAEAGSGRVQTDLDRGWALREALDRLPKEQREVLILRHVVGLSPVEIADVLNKTEGSVQGLHRRGRRMLERNLAELGAPPAVALPAA